jgi:two-component system sensor histidine kinase TctE
MTRGRPSSLRRRLLLGILLPLAAVIAINTVVLYRQALRAADTAYDRTLLATAKSIGELLSVTADAGGGVRLQAEVPYSALEAFEADNRSLLYYRVLGFDGEPVSGFEDLPAARRDVPARGAYAALVHFYADTYRGRPVRMAVLLQPVAGVAGQGMATVQVAETLEVRRALAQELLLDTLLRQAVLVTLVAAVVLVVVQRATRPVRELSAQIVARPAGDLTPIATDTAPRELLPLIEATNQVMARLARLVAHQKRFVRDASHQLRTPLAVLKTQVQSARRGDVEPDTALAEIGHTVDRATGLANQMLALAKVEQLRQEGEPPVTDFAAEVREVALDLAPLMVERGLEVSSSLADAAPVRAHPWALRELVRNLLHNAVKQSPSGGSLTLTLARRDGSALLTIADQGPGIAPALRDRLFQPFAAQPAGGELKAGAGLGLAICREIVESLAGELSLDNRPGGGLDAVVRLPLAAA